MALPLEFLRCVAGGVDLAPQFFLERQHHRQQVGERQVLADHHHVDVAQRCTRAWLSV
jgi:hypothetical protein